MRKYIVDLTDQLIGRNGYDRPPFNLLNHSQFVQCIKEDLWLGGDVSEMNPETLGKIMGSLEIGDVVASKAELLGALSFSGSCEDLLRELVALCLAFVIRDRLDPGLHSSPSIPPYKARRRDHFEKEYRRDQDEQIRHGNPPGSAARAFGHRSPASWGRVKFVRLCTGLGTSSHSRGYFGPFLSAGEADAFIRKVKTELRKLRKAFSIGLVDVVPAGWSAVQPNDVQYYLD